MHLMVKKIPVVLKGSSENKQLGMFVEKEVVYYVYCLLLNTAETDKMAS